MVLGRCAQGSLTWLLRELGWTIYYTYAQSPRLKSTDTGEENQRDDLSESSDQ